jgi:muramidase (phage lysozyme)
MPNQPTALQIRERAERRMQELGHVRPQPGDASFEAKQRLYDERFDRQLQDAEIHLTRVHAVEQQREDAAAALERQRLNDQVAQLRVNFLAQPGATLNDFERALPELLAESRKQATLAGDTEHQRAIA